MAWLYQEKSSSVPKETEAILDTINIFIISSYFTHAISKQDSSFFYLYFNNYKEGRILK